MYYSLNSKSDYLFFRALFLFFANLSRLTAVKHKPRVKLQLRGLPVARMRLHAKPLYLAGHPPQVSMTSQSVHDLGEPPARSNTHFYTSELNRLNKYKCFSPFQNFEKI